MTDTLSPKELSARAMLLLHSKSPLDQLRLNQAMSDAMAQAAGSAPVVTQAMLDEAARSAIQGLGYATDLGALRNMHEQLSRSHAGLWSGAYTLVDSQHRLHRLSISSADITLNLATLPDAITLPSEGDAYASRRIQFKNADVAIDLRIHTSLDEVQGVLTSEALAHAVEGFQVTVEGTLAFAGAEAVTVQGKRGVSTPAGVFAERGEDPPQVWGGRYQLRRTDEDGWPFLDEPLTLALDAGGTGLTVSLGELQASNVVYHAGVVTGTLAMGGSAPTRLTIELSIISSGDRRLFAWTELAGTVRTLTGYGTRALDTPTFWGAQAHARRLANRALAAAAVTSMAATAGPSDDLVNFFRTPYDRLISCDDLLPPAATTGTTTAQVLLGGSVTLDIYSAQADEQGNHIKPTAFNGFRVNETDASGNETGRIAIFSLPAGAPALKLLGETTLMSYQRMNASKQAQPGLDNSLLGFLVPGEFQLPSMVETSFYEVRVSVTGLAAEFAAGVRIDFAVEDAHQPTLLRIAQPKPADVSAPATYAAAGMGPEPDVKTAVPDFTKASALVRATTGETQIVGHKLYYLALSRAGGTGVAALQRQVFKPNGQGFEPEGAAQTVQAPLLAACPIDMDSRDALEVSGTSWAPAARGKRYSSRIDAAHGTLPYTWRLLANDLPPGLSWTPALAGGSDHSDPGTLSVALTGTVNADVDPGSTYQPRLRVMSDRSVVMGPAYASPQLTIVEPETEMKQAWEVTNTLGSLLAMVAGVAALVVAIMAYRRDGKAGDRASQSDSAIALGDVAEKKVGQSGATLDELVDAMATSFRDQKTMKDMQQVIDRLAAESTLLKQSINTLRQELKDARSRGDSELTIELIEKKMDQKEKREETVTNEEGKTKREKEKHTEKKESK